MNLASGVFYSLGVTGFPLGHSLSPVLHAAALRDTGLSGEYRLYPVSPQPSGESELDALMARLRRGSLDGLNVTIPHKQAVMPYLDELTPLARQIGAVNTIFHAGDRLIGDNTDAPGFMADLRAQWPQAVQAGTAFVLGAGGSARAVVYALLMAGWRVTILARRIEPARLIQAGAAVIQQAQGSSAPCNVLKWDALPEAIHSMNTLNTNDHSCLIVNTTPVGMHPNVDYSPWPVGLPFPQQVFVYDLVYNPLETKLVRSARAGGVGASNGLGMLIEQAALAFERWTGMRPSTAAMRRAVTNV
jgi:shikimate dehydrogenase